MTDDLWPFWGGALGFIIFMVGFSQLARIVPSGWKGFTVTCVALALLGMGMAAVGEAFRYLNRNLTGPGACLIGSIFGFVFLSTMSHQRRKQAGTLERFTFLFSFAVIGVAVLLVLQILYR